MRFVLILTSLTVIEEKVKCHSFITKRVRKFMPVPGKVCLFMVINELTDIMGVV